MLSERKRGFAFFLASMLAGCTWAPRDTGFDAENLCALHVKARDTGKHSEFLTAVARALDVEPANIRLADDGVFVETSEFFVEQQGFFIARPGADLRADGDPSFEHVRACIYRYKVVG